MSTPGAIAQHEAEITVYRAAAIRALCQTGATHDEAAAVVDEHVRAALAVEHARLEYMLARMGDTLGEAWERLRPALDAMGRALAGIHGPRVTQADVVLQPTARPAGEQDRVRALIADKRNGRGAGPRAPRMDGRRAA